MIVEISATIEPRASGVQVVTGFGMNVLGGPLNAVHWLVRGLAGGLRAGEIVTTGTLTEALPLQPGERWQHSLAASIALEPVALEFPLTGEPFCHTPGFHRWASLLT